MLADFESVDKEEGLRLFFGTTVAEMEDQGIEWSRVEDEEEEERDPWAQGRAEGRSAPVYSGPATANPWANYPPISFVSGADATSAS